MKNNSTPYQCTFGDSQYNLSSQHIKDLQKNIQQIQLRCKSYENKYKLLLKKLQQSGYINQIKAIIHEDIVKTDYKLQKLEKYWSSQRGIYLGNIKKTIVCFFEKIKFQYNFERILEMDDQLQLVEYLISSFLQIYNCHSKSQNESKVAISNQSYQQSINSAQVQLQNIEQKVNELNKSIQYKNQLKYCQENPNSQLYQHYFHKLYDQIVKLKAQLNASINLSIQLSNLKIQNQEKNAQIRAFKIKIKILKDQLKQVKKQSLEMKLKDISQYQSNKYNRKLKANKFNIENKNISNIMF